MEKRIIFWDWTGTLADEAQLDRAVCQSLEKEIARRHHLPPEEAASLFQAYLRRLEGTWEWHDYLRHARHFGLDWRPSQSENLPLLRLLPGAREILKLAKDLGWLNILATNAVKAVIELRLQWIGLFDIFDDIITSDMVQSLKSAGKHFLYGLQKWSAQATDSFSVGDNPVQDIQSAKTLGLKTIFCSFGRKLTHYHSPHISPDHHQPVVADYQVASLGAIRDILLEKSVAKEATHG
ncbi:MAG: HAD family hydrolase [Candidatus Aminicenantes bacterium]|nr:HAD family hydrolase [Candidatus Aminicenantes bacterium]